MKYKMDVIDNAFEFLRYNHKDIKEAIAEDISFLGDIQNGGIHDRFTEDLHSRNYTWMEAAEIIENWCLGQAFIYGDLCFINQVDGGDEWLTMKRFADEVVCFESISWVPSIERDDFEEQFSRLEKATKQQCESLTY